MDSKFRKLAQPASRKDFTRTVRNRISISDRTDSRLHGRFLPIPIMRDSVKTWDKNHAAKKDAKKSEDRTKGHTIRQSRTT